MRLGVAQILRAVQQGRPTKDRYLVVSQHRGTSYRPQNTIMLFAGTPKKVPPLILGNNQFPAAAAFTEASHR